MIPIHTLLHTALSGNQFASGGMLLMALGAVGASLRKVPAIIWAHMVRQGTISVTIVDGIPPFDWCKEWYVEQEHCKRSRRIDMAPTSEFVLAPGKHWFFYKGRPLWVEFTRTTDDHNVSGKRLESFTLTTVGRSQSYFRDLTKELWLSHSRREEEKPALFIRDNGWDEIGSYKPRLLNTVILPQEQKDRVINDLEQFRKSQNWYESMGIPYHRGYLLHGPPGTGKTSFVTALSSHFKNRVYLIDLNMQTDDTLAHAVRYCHKGSFIVLEDVDCCTKKRIKKETRNNAEAPTPTPAAEASVKGVTLSGLLNVLDGIQSPSGVAFFMTTNHVEALDVALLRPGRVDLQEYIGPASAEQKTQLYFAFFPEDTKEAAAEFIGRATEALTMASMQGELLKERNARLQSTKKLSAIA